MSANIFKIFLRYPHLQESAGNADTALIRSSRDGFNAEKELEVHVSLELLSRLNNNLGILQINYFLFCNNYRTMKNQETT